MIEEPGSFSGSESSPKPQRGPEPKQRVCVYIGYRNVPCYNIITYIFITLPRRRMSFAIFIKETATVLRAPLTSTIVS